ncbi:MAG TPA: ABC transporter permease [Cyclobacteriaceae bacterium]|jgi:ABC-2 type transport system permease protein|nr:ABC transporter permease [Cytophagales bacterium]HMR56343.1 ABC transporter permease [Cyclobacteriaceae bacterium]HNT49081.1 ABC transporter permease [Cyclobacteriaceae bacterium]HRE66008.1 ABC transporter permease [Cyclobacteriaceae bacterium]HRF33980.1 ABC transporter permease [Cyclobacteriaceae bacterium]
MNKVWLIIQREFLNRVQKKSFLIATILVPLIFPVIIGGLVYVAIKESESAKAETVQVLDESKLFTFTNSKRFTFVPIDMPLEQAKKVYNETQDFGLLYIPAFDINKPEGVALYTKENPSVEKVGDLQSALEQQIHDLKLKEYNIDESILKSLRPKVSMKQFNLTETGEEKSSNSGLLYGLGFLLGILIYMFVLIYGIQIMQGVIDEKTSKIVEVIVSSVKPFQLMLGKILGIASVGLLQFTIWIVLISVLSSVTMGYFGAKMPQQQAMEQVSKQMASDPEMKEAMNQQNGKVTEFLTNASEIPFTKIALVFVFYFLGGYLLYGALFAAVGSAVDSQQEAQQFQFPVTIPLLIGYMGLFMFILRDPHGPISFWLSIIPFTSPVAMVGRIGYGVPDWQLALSIVLLIGGFLLTTWIAGRIYRVGILMTGTKVSYKVLAKWFMQKG